MKIEPAIRITDCHAAAQLYWDAFGDKLGLLMGPTEKAVAFIKTVMNPQSALAAYDDAGQLLGVIGYKTRSGSFVDGTLRDFQTAYGLIRGTLRGLTLSLLDRDVDNQNFLLDGVCVSPAARGPRGWDGPFDSFGTDRKNPWLHQFAAGRHRHQPARARLV